MKRRNLDLESRMKTNFMSQTFEKRRFFRRTKNRFQLTRLPVGIGTVVSSLAISWFDRGVCIPPPLKSSDNPAYHGKLDFCGQIYKPFPIVKFSSI